MVWDDSRCSNKQRQVHFLKSNGLIMSKKLSILLLAFGLLMAFSSAQAGENLIDVEIYELDIRVADGFALARLSQSYSTCAYGNYVKLPLTGTPVSESALSVMLTAQVTGAKLDILSSDTCDHFNVLERIKIK